MLSALEQFRVSIARVRDLIALHHSLQNQATPVLDLSDMLRSALVLAVSALDFYIHEVVTLGVVAIYQGERAEPIPRANVARSAFSRFQISLGGAKRDRDSLKQTANDLRVISTWLNTQISATNSHLVWSSAYTSSLLIHALSNDVQNELMQARWLEDEIRERLSYQSFQKPHKIAEVMRLISEDSLWDAVATQLNRPASDIKQQLNLIVDRRNKIAHEADIDPTYGIGNRWAINESMVDDAVTFIEQVVDSIHHFLS